MIIVRSKLVSIHISEYLFNKEPSFKVYSYINLCHLDLLFHDIYTCNWDDDTFKVIIKMSKNRSCIQKLPHNFVKAFIFVKFTFIFEDLLQNELPIQDLITIQRTQVILHVLDRPLRILNFIQRLIFIHNQKIPFVIVFAFEICEEGQLDHYFFYVFFLFREDFAHMILFLQFLLKLIHHKFVQKRVGSLVRYPLRRMRFPFFEILHNFKVIHFD